MHIGKNISKIRELLGIKQETLAYNLKISQQTISKIEQTENLRDKTVDRIANALGVEASMILNYNENAVVEFIKGQLATKHQPSCSLIEIPNPVIKIIELYERLLISEKEKLNIFSSVYKSNSIRNES